MGKLKEDTDNNCESESKSNTDNKSDSESNPESKDKSKSASWFGWEWGRKHYEGGFQAKMNRKEAALILGVRANSCEEMIMDRYRSIIISSHEFARTPNIRAAS